MADFYKVRSFDKGFIALMPRPDGGDKLRSSIERLREDGVQVLVSLLEPSEVERLALQQEGLWCSRSGVDFMTHPVPDLGVPADRALYRRLVIELMERALRGDGVVIHCWGGVGRSGLLVAAILTALGTDYFTACGEVSKARGEEVPEISCQRRWLEHNESYLRQG